MGRIMPFFYQGFRKSRLIYPLLFSSVILVQLVFLAGVYFFCSSLLAGGMNPVWAGRKGMVILSLFEVSFYLLALPLILCLLLPINNKAVQRNLLIILPYRQRTKWKEMLNTAIFIMFLILPSVIPAGYLHAWHIPTNIIIRFILTLFFIVLFLSAVNHFTYSLFRDTFASITTTYLVMLSLIGGIILMNPVIEWAGNPEGIIQTTLLVNPFVAIASSINLDILRTDPLYYLSSISAYNFRYPRPVQFWLFYSFMFFALFVIKTMFLEKSELDKNFLKIHHISAAI